MSSAVAGSSAAVASLWQRMERLLDKIATLDDKGWFATPVDPVAFDLPTYTTIIKHPMDLGTVRAKLAEGRYADLQDMAKDINLVFDNAKQFNTPEMEIHKLAAKIQDQFVQRFEPLLDEWYEKTNQQRPPAPEAAAAASTSKKRKSAPPEPALAHVDITDATRPTFVAALNDMTALAVSECFREPVDLAATPTYSDIVKQPVSLRSIKMKLFNKSMKTSAEMDADMQLLHDNAKLFNAGNDESAKSIRKDAKSLLDRWRTRLKKALKQCASGASDAVDDAATDSDEESTASSHPTAAAAKRPKHADKSKKGAASSSASSYHDSLLSLLTSFMSKLSADSKELFEFPVSKASFPEYYDLIKRPICLSDILSTLTDKHTYDHAPAVFLADLALVWANCRSFNEPGSGPYKEADKSQKIWDKLLEAAKSPQQQEIRQLEAQRKSAAGDKGGAAAAKEKPAAAAKEKPAAAAAASDASSSKRKSVAAAKGTPAASAAATPAVTAAASTVAAAAAPSASSTNGGIFSASRCRQVLSRLCRDSSRVAMFKEPVDTSKVEHYDRLIKKPMCITWVQEKITRSSYQTNGEMATDIELIWKNCIDFNTMKSEYGVLAAGLRAEFRKLYKDEFKTDTPTVHAEQDAKQAAKQKELAELEASLAKLKAEKAAAAAPKSAPKPSTPAPPAAAAVKSEPKAAPAPAAAAAAAVPSAVVKTEPASSAAAASASAPPAVAANLSNLSTAAVAHYHAAQQSLKDFYTAELKAQLSQPIDVDACERLIKSVWPSAKSFQSPVPLHEYTDYTRFVSKPMDLTTIRTKLRDGLYPTFEQFVVDVELVWSNAMAYNPPGHAVWMNALSMRSRTHKLIHDMFKEAASKNRLPEPVVKRMIAVLNDVKKAAPTYGQSYFEPIETSTAGEFEAYKAKIAQPIDLGKVVAKLNANEYESVDDVYDDSRRVFRNALQFYGATNVYGLQSQYLLNEFDLRVREMEFGLVHKPPTVGKKSSSKLAPLQLLRRPTGSMTPSTPSLGAAGEAGETPLVLDTPPVVGETPMEVDSGAASSSFSYPVSTMSAEDAKKCSEVIEKLLADQRLFAFSSPVDPSLYAGFGCFFQVVREPMDLRTIKRKLAIRAYATADDVCKDVKRITDNAKLFYAQPGAEIAAGADAVLKAGDLLDSMFDEAWKSWSAVKQPKLKAAAAAASAAPIASAHTPAYNNLAPPPAYRVPSPAASLSPSPSPAPPSTVAAAAAVSAKSSEAPPGMSAEEWAARRKHKEEKRAAKALKKEAKRKKREAAGHIDVAGESAPVSPNSGAEDEAMPQAVAAVPAYTGGSAAAALPPAPAPRLKIPKHPAAAEVPTASPARRPVPVAQPATVGATAIMPHAPVVSRIVFKKEVLPTAAPSAAKVVPVRPSLSFAARKRILEAARSKQVALSEPATLAAAKAQPLVVLDDAASAGDAMDVDSADSTALPTLTPSGAIAAPPPLVSQISALPSFLQSQPSVMQPVAPRPQMHRAHSYLAAMLERPPPTDRKSKDRKAKKRQEKWRANVAAQLKAQEQVNLRAKARERERRSEKERELAGDFIEVMPTRSSSAQVAAYRDQGFQADHTDTLVRIVHTTLPPTALFPFPIDQHLLLFARANNSDEPVSVELLLHAAAVSRLESTTEQAFEQWQTIKSLADETRVIEETHETDFSLFHHPLTSSNLLSTSIAFFSALAPSLEWQPSTACYSHALDFSSVPAADDDSKEAYARSASPVHVSFESVLEMGLRSDSDDSEADEHAGDQRATAAFADSAAKRRRVTDVGSGVPTHAALACSGLVLWSLPGSLALRVQGREYAESPFERIGVWRPLDDIRAEQAQREERMHAITQRSVDKRQQQEKLLTLLRS